MTKKTYLGHWLAFLGEPHLPLAKRFGLSSAAVSVAIRTNGRQGGWILALADYLGLPQDILLDISPADPAAREHRARALARASARRLAKFEKAQAERERRGVPLHWKVRPPLGPRGRRKASIALAVWLGVTISTGAAVAGQPLGSWDAAVIAAQLEAAQKHQAASRNMGVADEGCFMGECFKEFIVSLVRDKSGLATVKTRVEYYCAIGDTGNCSVPEQQAKAEYKVQCNSPGGYVEAANGARVPEPDPNPPHATWATLQLWASVCRR